MPDRLNSLIAGFAPVTFDDWVKVAEKALKGRPLEQLTRTTLDGLTIKPLYTAADWARGGLLPEKEVVSEACSNRWEIRPLYAHPSIEANRAAIADDRKNGLTSAHIELNRTVRLGIEPVLDASLSRRGVAFATVSQLEALLEGALQGDVWLNSGANGLVILAMLDAVITRMGVDWADVRGGLGCDPLGALATDGELPHSLEQSLFELAQVVRFLSDEGRGLKAITVSARHYHNAGATVSEELAIPLATGVEYLRSLSEQELDPELVAEQLSFELPVGSNLLLEVAKLRAVRRLWADVLEACQISGSVGPIHISVCSSERSRTARDPWINLLRATTEVMVGGLGGADSVTTFPFDSELGTGDELGRRLARNTQLILQHEANLHRVVDPARGSWSVESLTEQVAKHAWSTFQEIESAGGMTKELLNGSIHRRMASSAERRRRAVETGKIPSVGVSVFPLLDENSPESKHARLDEVATANEVALGENRETRTIGQTLVELANASSEERLVKARQAAFAGATLGELSAALSRSDQKERLAPLPATRDSAQFEAFRDASDQHLGKTGARPKAFLVTLGSLAACRLRAMWVTNFLAAGGIQAIGGDELSHVDDPVEDFRSVGCPVAVICSTNERYLHDAQTLIPALRQAGATLILMVGKLPLEEEEFCLQAGVGVDAFIHKKTNAVDMLRTILEVLTARGEGAE